MWIGASRRCLSPRTCSHASSLHAYVDGSATTDALPGRISLRNANGSARSGSSIAVRPEQLVLVARARLDARHEQLPHAGLAAQAHRVHAPVPRVPVAGDADARRVGRPHREARAAHAVDLVGMRAQHAVQIEVIALREQPRVELAEQRPEAVRIVERARRAVGVRDAQPVARRHFRRAYASNSPASPTGSASASTRSFSSTTASARAPGTNARTTVPAPSSCGPEHGERIAFAAVLDRGEALGRKTSTAVTRSVTPS